MWRESGKDTRSFSPLPPSRGRIPLATSPLTASVVRVKRQERDLTSLFQFMALLSVTSLSESLECYRFLICVNISHTRTRIIYLFQGFHDLFVCYIYHSIMTCPSQML